MSSAPSGAPSLGSRLASWPGACPRTARGEPIAIFGFSPATAREVLFPVGRARALPADYQPADLVAAPGARAQEQVRAIVVPDLDALLAAAQGAGLSLRVVSGFRSCASQQALFERRVRRWLEAGSGADREAEAREQVNLETALPGHSQHQLGTVVDFSTPELGHQVLRSFAETTAGRWLRAHAWEYGGVFPYTEAGRPRTGYIAEPWHLRWVGRPLAACLAADRYLDRPDLVVDDYLETIECWWESPAGSGISS